MNQDIGDFTDLLGFTLDEFQTEAIAHLESGTSVLVAAPTGAGKTVVGEWACHEALRTGRRAFYTTPIKALSNQKFRDLQDTYGIDQVGLLTGDRGVNGDAPIVVMTTEVLRNMIYESSKALDSLQFVVLDEVHYLADRSRGAVWEEILIQLPRTVQVAALSATVSNAEEFGEWLDQVRGGCEVVLTEHRPVPLEHHFFVNDRLYPTFRMGDKNQGTKQQRQNAAQARGGVPNPDVLMLERSSRKGSRVNKRGHRVPTGPRLRWPGRPEVIEELAHRNWLPAILFVFSRAGCDKAVQELRSAGVSLTSREERDEIARIVDTLVGDLPRADLDALHFTSWRESLQDGVAAHHAGMVPAFKEVVEVLFQSGLLKVVAATETLALGINMPARTVVIERLEKWNGETHELLTAGQYTQLTGRAGRRGIDTIGHAVVLYQRDVEFKTVAGLVGTRTYPLSSSFAPSYNMAVNLLRQHSLDEAELLLAASFAQFQADRGTAGLGRRLAELDQGIRGYASHLTCDQGDWAAYWSIRRGLSQAEKQQSKSRRKRQRSALADGLAALDPGAVLSVPWLGRRGLAAVVAVMTTSAGTPLVDVVTDDRTLTRLGPRELDRLPPVVGHIELPDRGTPRQRDYRGDVASRLRSVDPDAAHRTSEDVDERSGIDQQRAAMKEHPCHTCDDLDEHVTWQRRADTLIDEASSLRQRIEHRTGSLVRHLHRILDVLLQLGYVDKTPEPTDDGLRLAGLYADTDLLLAEVLRRGLADDLDAAELAGLCAHLLYEPRGGDPTEHAWIPTGTLADILDQVDDVAEELREIERRAGLTPTGDLDAGFVSPAYRWAKGRDLDEALDGLDMTGGDFVRNVKRVADLAGQLRQVSDGRLRVEAGLAVDGLRRGIVEQ